MPANLENSAVATRMENVSFHFNPKEGQCQRMLKLFYCTIALVSLASKVMLKILQSRLQQYVNGELPAVQAGFYFILFFKLDFKKAKEPEVKLPTSVRS